MDPQLAADNATVCAGKVAPDAPVRIRPTARAGDQEIAPADAEFLCDRVIVFRPKQVSPSARARLRAEPADGRAQMLTGRKPRNSLRG